MEERTSILTKVERKKINVPQPGIFRWYNRKMGGVDQIDANIAVYRKALMGKSWSRQFCGSSRSTNGSLKDVTSAKLLLQFWWDVVYSFLLRYGESKIPPGIHPSRSATQVPNFVLEGGDRLILSQQVRMRFAVCKNMTTKARKSCKVPLHHKCFNEFHS